MICLLLPLFIATSRVCAGTFVVNVTKTSYQAEENDSITLEWMFTSETDRPHSFLSVFCERITADDEISTLYHLHEGVEVPESQDGRLAGRVQCDKDVLAEGRLRLHVSRLRTEDSGHYLCEVNTNDGTNAGGCRLNVTAAADEAQPLGPAVEVESWTSQGALVVVAAVVTAGLFVCAAIHISRIYSERKDKRSIISAARRDVGFVGERSKMKFILF